MSFVQTPYGVLYQQALGLHAKVWVTSKSIATREGASQHDAAYDGNLALHVKDNPQHVANRRIQLSQQVGKPIQWLNQVHGVDVHVAHTLVQDAPTADASMTGERTLALGMLTADCLPLVMASNDGQAIAAAHAGWKGLLAGIIENTYLQLRKTCPNATILTHLGPCIGVAQFEVGDDVRTLFVAQQQSFAQCFTRTHRLDRTTYLCDLERLARLKLHALGVSHISGGGWCTVSDPRLHSYRRSSKVNQPSGRFATVIALVA